MFIKNTWYVAAWSHEIGEDTLLARIIIGKPIVLWRNASGRIKAFDDRCCHRGAPLSLGRHEGNTVRCMYHGLQFDGDGKCIQVPSQRHISPLAAVRAYAVVERFRWIWIWMGAAEEADPTLIPDTHYLDDPAWRGTPGYMHYAANYLLIADNLLDFSHLAYVHETTLGGSAKYAQTLPSVTRTDRGIRVERWLMNDEPAPFLRGLKSWQGNVDRWNNYDFVVPGVLLMDSGSAPVGTGAKEGQRVDAAEFFGCQAITPETDKTTHYFFQQSHNFALDDPNVTEQLRLSVLQGFQEDKDVITAQQRMLDLDPDFKMLGMRMDAGLGMFRSLVDKLIGDEQQRGNRIPLLLGALSFLLTLLVSPVWAQAVVAVHGLKVGQCVEFSDFSGMHKGTIAQPESGGGYQVNWNGISVPVGANSRDIQPCPAGTNAPAGTNTPAGTNAPAGTSAPVGTNAPAVNAAAPATSPTAGFKVGDCVQFSYGGGWETATIAKPEVAGAYQVNWGAIVVPASANPKDIRACPAHTAAAGSDAATTAALAKLPKDNSLGARYGTRNPATCANRKVAITPATAEQMVACEKEGLLGDALYLITDVAVQVGRPRAFDYNQDSAATAIDARQPVYDIRGSYTLYRCEPLSAMPNAFAKTHNCVKYPAAPGGYGRCYTNTFGDKQCVMTGGGPTELKDQMPPPAH